MKGIYGGSIVEVKDCTDLTVEIIYNGSTIIVARCKVIDVTEEYKLVDEEFRKVNDEIKNITSRIQKLDEEYFRKKNLLQEMLMNARSKEIAIVSKLVRKEHS